MKIRRSTAVWQSLTKEMEDTLGICVYVGTWSGAYALEPSDYAELANGVLGTDLNEEDLFFQARRSYNLEKAFNTLHTDFDRKDDYPPEDSGKNRCCPVVMRGRNATGRDGRRCWTGSTNFRNGTRQPGCRQDVFWKSWISRRWPAGLKKKGN